MAWETIGAGITVLMLTALWYGLQVVALRDLHARPRVRGNNKLLWAFAILCVPFVGALGYLSVGPTSFLAQPQRVARGRTGRTAASGGRSVIREPAHLTSSRGDGGRGTRNRPVLARPARTPVRVPVMLAVDPVVGTDSSEILGTRVVPTTVRRLPGDVIRWPGSSIPRSDQQPDYELRD